MYNNIYNRQANINLKSYDVVTVVGVGGVGSWVALFLSLSGRIKKIQLIDNDVVEESNLNRTPYRPKDIGRKKVNAMKELIQERNGAVEVIAIDNSADWESHDRHFLENLVLDCRDSVDLLSTLSPIIAGYDGSMISLTSNYQEGMLIDSGASRSGYTSAWIGGAVLCASLIVNYILLGVDVRESTSVTYDVKDLIKIILGLSPNNDRLQADITHNNICRENMQNIWRIINLYISKGWRVEKFKVVEDEYDYDDYDNVERTLSVYLVYDKPIKVTKCIYDRAIYSIPEDMNIHVSEIKIEFSERGVVDLKAKGFHPNIEDTQERYGSVCVGDLYADDSKQELENLCMLPELLSVANIDDGFTGAPRRKIKEFLECMKAMKALSPLGEIIDLEVIN